MLPATSSTSNLNSRFSGYMASEATSSRSVLAILREYAATSSQYQRSVLAISANPQCLPGPRARRAGILDARTAKALARAGAFTRPLIS
jgi:hypothetical protein